MKAFRGTAAYPGRVSLKRLNGTQSPTVGLMKDNDVRPILHTYLHEIHAAEPDTLIVDELGLHNGASRVDVASINGQITGWEIKAPRDRLDRLPSQVSAYSSVCDTAWLVTDERHLTNASSILPDWWGIMVLADTGGVVRLCKQRAAHGNPSIDPGSVVRLLWKSEALELLIESGASANTWKRKTRREMWAELVAALTKEQLCAAVRLALKSRNNWH